jgi:hypothetical protein
VTPATSNVPMIERILDLRVIVSASSAASWVAAFVTESTPRHLKMRAVAAEETTRSR